MTQVYVRRCCSIIASCTNCNKGFVRYSNHNHKHILYSKHQPTPNTPNAITPITAQATTTHPSSTTLPALPWNCDGSGDATDVLVGPGAELVGLGSANADVGLGNGGKNVAETGVGSAMVAESASKLDCASALFAAKTLTVVVVVTVLEVVVLRARDWT